jgi:hypothetical protein
MPCLCPFPDIPFGWDFPMDLAVMPPDLLTKIFRVGPFCLHMPCNAIGIGRMRFFQVMRDTGILRLVAIGQAYVFVRFPEPTVESPAHDPHEGGIPETHAAMYGFRQCDFALMIPLMTGLTKRNQVIGGISSGLTAFDVMDIQYRVAGFALTALAGMLIPKEDVFPDVLPTGLFSLLIAFP